MADYKGNTDLHGQKRLRVLGTDRFPSAIQAGNAAPKVPLRLCSLSCRCLIDCVESATPASQKEAAPVFPARSHLIRLASVPSDTLFQRQEHFQIRNLKCIHKSFSVRILIAACAPVSERLPC